MGYKLDGGEVTIFGNSDEIYALNEITATVESTRLDGTSRASGDYEAAIPGDYSGTGTGSAMYTADAISDKINGRQVIEGALNKTLYTLQYRRVDPANTNIDKFVTVDAYISNISLTLTRNEVVVNQVTFQFTGEIEINTEGS